MLFLGRPMTTLVLAVCAAGAAFSAPNLLPREAAEALPVWLPRQQVSLGLDLQGGSHLLLDVDLASLTQERLETAAESIRFALRGSGLGDAQVAVADGAIAATPPAPEAQAAILEAVRELNARPSRRFGLSGEAELEAKAAPDGRVLVRLSEDALQERARAAIDLSIEIVRRRIDEVGTREPSIQRHGRSRILVQLPGEQDPERVKRLLGKTAKLTFRLVDSSMSADEAAAAGPSSGLEVLEADPRSSERPERRVVQKRAVVSGETLVDAQAAFERGQPVVSFRFDPAGARQLADATRENVGKLLAIVLDDKIVSAPLIREPIIGGSGVISGRFTPQEANELGLLLRAGALPAPLEVVEERTVGPALGADSIRAGAIACAVGMLLVVGLMIAAYGFLGLIATLGLIVNMQLIFAALSLLQATLTLPGVAGILLTIGMAVDGNVLVFERIREEARVGRPPIAATEAGFARAAATILDSNLTTLIAAAFLYMIGSGPVRGFAVTLAIGILSSMFTSVLFARLALGFWLQRARPAALPL